MSAKRKTQTNILDPRVLAKALDSEQAHTSFGNLPLSIERTSPGYSFAGRNSSEKLYLEHDNTTNIGKTSPGPKYNIRDQTQYKTPPKFSMGTAQRKFELATVRYDHYEIKDTFTDPASANNAVKRNYGGAKFGTESRNPHYDLSQSPGPAYSPNISVSKKDSPKYSLGARRLGPSGGLLEAKTSTTPIAGPGRYRTENVFTSRQRNVAKWTFPRGEKIGRMLHTTASKHQSYDTNSKSIGSQVSSKKRSMPQVSMPQSTREQWAKTGHFNASMSQSPVKFRADHSFLQ